MSSDDILRLLVYLRTKHTFSWCFFLDIRVITPGPIGWVHLTIFRNARFSNIENDGVFLTFIYNKNNAFLIKISTKS